MTDDIDTDIPPPSHHMRDLDIIWSIRESLLDDAVSYAFEHGFDRIYWYDTPGLGVTPQYSLDAMADIEEPFWVDRVYTNSPQPVEDDDDLFDEDEYHLFD
jgi:hypothetical protein